MAPVISKMHRRHTKQPATVEKEKIIFRYRVRGWTFEQIAERLDMTVATVYKLYKQAIKAEVSEDVDELRLVEGARLDLILAPVLNEVEDHLRNYRAYEQELLQNPTGKTKEGLPIRPPAVPYEAIETVLRISERRSRLFGIDKPAQLTLTAPNTTEEQRQFSSMLQQLPPEKLIEAEKAIIAIENKLGETH